tara:strand:- start:298 stop:498 length:201 start_codon:yes stop_codon:yes gene_type:complete
MIGLLWPVLGILIYGVARAFDVEPVNAFMLAFLVGGAITIAIINANESPNPYYDPPPPEMYEPSFG